MNTQKLSLGDEATAMKKIGEEFEKLNSDAQGRVISWLVSVVKNVANFQENPLNFENDQQPLSRKLEGKDIKPFWKGKSPKNNYQKLAVLGYFLEFTNGKDEFTKEELRQAWKDTREACPADQVLTNSINDTLSKYHYFVAGSQGRRYRMGARGQQLVEAMPNPGKELLGFSKKSKKRKK